LSPPGIEVEALSKRYGDLVAVDDVHFSVRPGVLYGLLGPNGAGKSTTIGCISGLVAPSSGRVRVLGHDVVADARAARARLGIVPQELALYEDLSARENVEYWAAAYGLAGNERRTRVGEVLELVGLTDRARDAVKKLSGGMKRRLNFACGIVHRPAVLLLDEPTVGVDPQSRVRLLDLVRAEARAGVAVLYTTHYMEEAESLCDELGVIDHGKIIARGTLAELRGMLGERDLVRLSGTFDPARTAAALRAAEGLGGAELVQCEEREVTLALEGATRRMPALFAALAAAGAEVRETTLSQPSLESLFIKLTGKELRE
jgi:ABC-2 type transport system ATP-binding protein